MYRRATQPPKYVVLIGSLLFFSVALIQSTRSSTKYFKIKETALESNNKSNGQHGIDIATIGSSSSGEHPKNEEDPEKNQGINIEPETTPQRSDAAKEQESIGGEERLRIARQPLYSVATNLTKQATIVIQLSGELANNLHHIAHGIGLKHWSREMYGIEANVVLRHYVGPNNHQPKPKWKSARDNIRKCFPTLRGWDFARGNSKDFAERQRLQEKWLGKKRLDRFIGLINSVNETDIDKGLEMLSNDILMDPNRPLVMEDEKDTIRLPMLYSNSLDAFPMIDKYYDEIRKIFQFNDTACCAIVPNLDDYVFHFRNYQSEMPEYRAYEMGFLELSPEKTSTELFKKLQAGAQVKITTRIVNQKARNYVEAFSSRGINATLITDQTAVQDFCLLKRTSKELVGSARSTFVLWAALLGNVKTARLYHVDSWGLRKRHPDYWERFTYQWKNPELQQKVQFELFRSEEMEKW